MQHYHQLIEEEVKKIWSIPGEWRLISQMPYRLNDEKIEDREFIKFEDIVKIDQ